ncbi:MAG: HAD family phosphatase [Prevotellaceae bacterium]|jgi:putative hydrolase of the HAD superfamily|nr:HAD family phosphatase [Prevotellaceae bacterium]
MNNIKTIIFDLGGVLINLDTEAAVRNFKEIGFLDAHKYLGDYLQKGIFLEMEEGKLRDEEFYDKFRELSVNKNITNEQIEEAWCKILLDLPDYKLDLLLELRKKYRVFLLSNTNRIIAAHYTKHAFTQQGLTIDDYFDRRYVSYKIGCVKPYRGIFEYLIADSGIHPQEALFLDDGEQNIITAKEMGFQTYLVAPKEDFRHLFQ